MALEEMLSKQSEVWNILLNIMFLFVLKCIFLDRSVDRRPRLVGQHKRSRLEILRGEKKVPTVVSHLSAKVHRDSEAKKRFVCCNMCVFLWNIVLSSFVCN